MTLSRRLFGYGSWQQPLLKFFDPLPYLLRNVDQALTAQDVDKISGGYAAFSEVPASVGKGTHQ
jgi:hypothetical protein